MSNICTLCILIGFLRRNTYLSCLLAKLLDGCRITLRLYEHLSLPLSLSLSLSLSALAQPIVITPEGSKYWLSTEDVLAKGVPENEVENFK